MHNESDIRLVDPHSERIGGDNDINFTTHKTLLDLLPILGVHATVIKTETPFFSRKQLNDLFTLFSRRGVDDAGTWMRVQELSQCEVFFSDARWRSNF